MEQANVEPTIPEQPLEIPGTNEPVVQPTLGNPEGSAEQQPTTTDGGVVPPSPEEQPKPEEKKPKEDHYARRLNRFMNKAAELEAQNLALQAQILRSGKQTEGAPSEPQKPVRDNFASDDDYIQAQVDFQISKKLPEIQQRVQQATQQNTAVTVFQTRENELRKQNPDYDDIIAEASHIPIKNQIIADAIMMSDIGPDIRFHLAQNPEIMEKLNGMHPAKAATEIGKIESQLSNPRSAPAPVRPRAPAPIRSVVSNGVTVTVNPESMSMEDYVKYRNKARRDLGRVY